MRCGRQLSMGLWDYVKWGNENIETYVTLVFVCMFVCSMIKLIIRNCCFSLNLSKARYHWSGNQWYLLYAMGPRVPRCINIPHSPACHLPRPRQSNNVDITVVYNEYCACSVPTYISMWVLPSTVWTLRVFGAAFTTITQSPHFQRACLIIEHYKKQSLVLSGYCL